MANLPIGFRRSYTGSSNRQQQTIGSVSYPGNKEGEQFMSKLSSVKMESIEFAKRHFNGSNDYNEDEEEDMIAQ